MNFDYNIMDGDAILLKFSLQYKMYICKYLKKNE